MKVKVKENKDVAYLQTSLSESISISWLLAFFFFEAGLCDVSCLFSCILRAVVFAYKIIDY